MICESKIVLLPNRVGIQGNSFVCLQWFPSQTGVWEGVELQSMLKAIKKNKTKFIKDTTKELKSSLA